MSEPTFLHDEPRSNRRSFLKIAGVGGLALAAAGCDSDAPDDPVPNGVIGTLTGTVTNSDDGTPIPGVVVSLDSDELSDVSRTATTDENGSYTIERLPAVTYTVMVNVNNFVLEMEDANGMTVAITREVTVPDGGTVSADFALAPGGSIVLDLRTDGGLLNFAYALEQLEAAFYAAVVANPYAGITPDETQVLTALAAHEAIHRDFFEAAIRGVGGTLSNRGLIPNLEVDFSGVDFDSRESVLTTALTFEDLGVGAYNGAGQFFSDTEAGDTYLTLAGKIVSVEARHASVIAGLITPNALAAEGVIDDEGDTASGLDRALSPSDVLTEADPFIVNPISIA